MRPESLLEMSSTKQCELQEEMDFIPPHLAQERSDIVKRTLYENIIFVFMAALQAYGLYIYVILGYNRGTEIPQPFEPVCQNQCVVNIPISSVDEFNSFSLDRSHVVFVHFHANNLSLLSSNTTDILDPLNLVWVESIEAPILSLDLGFSVYSFTTLSRMVHHMKVKMETQSLNCLQNLNHSCLTATLAKSFLGTVTKERGVLCYAVNDTNTVNYRCCKGNVRTKQVECDIPAALSPEMIAIFKVTAIAAAFAILYFPAIFNIIPDKENSETLSSNTQVHNPLFQIGILAIEALRHPSDNYLLDTIRKLLIGATLPILYYVELGLTSHIKTYEIPQMFNNCVKEVWAKSKIFIISTAGPVYTNSSITLYLRLMIAGYVLVVVLFSLLPRREKLKFSSASSEYLAQVVHSVIQEEKDLKVNWLKPCYLIVSIFEWLKSCFEETWKDQGSFCCKIVKFLGYFVLLVLLPVGAIVIFIGYTVYISPLGQTLRPILNHAHIYDHWISDYLYKKCSIVYLIYKFFIFIALGVFVAAVATIFKETLLLSSRFIVYLLMGLIASKDYYFPLIAFISVFVYYSWDCVRSVTSRYQNLLQQTFEKCKELQEQQPNTRNALIIDDKGRPRISSQLFQNVIDEILPRSETYTNMILKLTVIVLFLCLTFYSILVFGISNLNQYAKALALLLTALVPKLVEIFGEGSQTRQLCELENACRVEKIVKNFLSQNDDGARENQITLDENQPSSADFHSSDVHV